MNRAEVRELECFVAVAENLSFSKAARLLNLTQPPLSRQIHKLEDRYSVLLFERNTRHVSLTAAGQVMLAEARALLRQHDRLQESLELAKSGRVERLTIGFTGTLMDEATVLLLKRFLDQRLDFQLRVSEINPVDAANALQQHQVDGVFIGTPSEKLESSLSMLKWKIPGYQVMISAEHPLAKRKSLKLADLAEVNWILMSREMVPSFHQRIHDACALAGYRPRIVHETPSQSALLAMVALGEGISLVSNAELWMRTPHVVLIPLKGALEKAEHAFLYRADETSLGVLAFLQYFKTEKRAR